MINRWLLIFFSLYCVAQTSVAQTIPSERLTDWTSPGSKTIFLFPQSINLSDFGADSSGNIPADSAFQQALIALNGPGEIFIPKGTYLFEERIILPDSTILRGEIDSIELTPLTLFKLSPGESMHGIQASGSEITTNYFIDYPLLKGESKIVVSEPELFIIGDFIRLKAYDDSSLVNNNWSYHTTGQIFEVLDINGNNLFLDKPLRRDYSDIYPPEILIIHPARQVHIQCLKLERLDETNAQTSNIFFQHAVDCSVSGIESTYCNFAHVELRYSKRITIENSYFTDAFSHGGGGKAYGVMLHFTTGDSYIHQNNFKYLRHSMILQAGANGNVLAYNYSTDPFWTLETLPLPSNSAGDLVLHGNYVYMNLMEGNVIQNIVIDNSHGINGPFNTFYRNRAELFGIFMNTSPASDSQNFIGNQITDNLYGFYALQGTGHFEYGNIFKGDLRPENSSEPDGVSFFGYNFPSFYSAIGSIPPVTTKSIDLQ